MVAAGTLNKECTLLRRTQTGVTELNEPVFEYLPVLHFRAAKTHLKEDEAFAASQRYAVRVVTFRTHYIEDVVETDKIVSEGVEYDIKGIREVGFRAGTEIACEAVL